MINIARKIEEPLMQSVTIKYDNGINERMLIETSHFVRRSAINILHRQLNHYRWTRAKWSNR